VIDVRKISKTFHVPHEVKALVEVSTKIDPGEVVVVCGPSGSGKSTFLRCLNRLEKADTGHIYIDGIDVLDPKTNINKLRAEVGMVFQSFNLFPHKTVFNNITLAQKVVRKRSKGDAREKADFLLKKVGIHEKSGAYPDNLSGGQQQRVATPTPTIYPVVSNSAWPLPELWPWIPKSCCSTNRHRHWTPK
jgi:polar amino acid transport system ATP-binding protein